MSMTGEFEVSKIEIVARLAEHLIPLAAQSSHVRPLTRLEHSNFSAKQVRTTCSSAAASPFG